MRNQLGISVVCLILACSGHVIIDSAIHSTNELELATCKQFVNTSDHEQKNDISVEDFRNPIERDYDDEILFDVFIRGNQEARIILSENNDYDLTEPLYEIVIGGSNNTYTSIYRNDKECLEEVHTPDVLWPEQFRKFTIQVTHAGYVRVYVAFYKAPLIEAINLHPIRINYILFSSIKVDNTSIEYYFDCGDDKYSTVEMPIETPIVIEAPKKCTASTHTYTLTFVWKVIFTSLALQLLIRSP